MQTTTAKVQEIFTMERRHVIPLFQRPYVWGEPQWEALWEDIREMAELLSEPGAARPPHFLGAIVLHGVPPTGKHISAFHVIDGQQRLTTLQLFLGALGAVAAHLDVRQAVDIAESWTCNRYPLVDKDVERWKVWPTRKDQEQYLKAMSAKSREVLAKEFPDRDPKDRRRKLKRPLMVAAWIYFYDAISSWVGKGDAGDEAVGERVLGLITALKNGLELVRIDLTEQENPQTIFETLNARGVPLLAADLLRNYIFQRAGTPTEAERLHQTYWKRFEADSDPDGTSLQCWWDEEERQGRFTRARLDLFLQHYLSSQTARVVRISDLFEDYKSWVRPSKNAAPFATVEEELTRLTRYASHFETLIRADITTPIGRFAYRIRAMDQSTVFPLVLWVMEANLPSAERLAILRDIESFLVRRMIAGRTTSGYNKLFLSLLNNLKKQAPPTAAGFRAELSASKADNAEWPDDVAFEKAWCEASAYDELGSGRVRMLLLALEDAMHGVKNVQVTVHGALSIEHVMPQQWQDEWPLPGGADTETETITRNESLHRFGNLTLITPAFNSALSNKSADKKLPELDQHGTLLLNRAFGGGRSTWSEQDIRDRTRTLFALACKVWPGPR